MSDHKYGIVHPMPNAPASVKAFLGMLIEQADDIEQIGCVITWKNGVTNTANTRMSLGHGVWMDWVFKQDFVRSLIGKDDDD